MAVRPIMRSDHEALNRLHRDVGWPERSPAGWRWLEANPHDDFAPEVRQQLTTAPLHHVTWTREYLGWGVFVLMAR